MIQLDGETSGKKIQAIKDYKLWFLNDDLSCKPNTVYDAIKMVAQGKVCNFFLLFLIFDEILQKNNFKLGGIKVKLLTIFNYF